MAYKSYQLVITIRKIITDLSKGFEESAVWSIHTCFLILSGYTRNYLKNTSPVSIRIQFKFSFGKFLNKYLFPRNYKSKGIDSFRTS